MQEGTEERQGMTNKSAMLKGAAMERKAVLAKVRRLIRQCGGLIELVAWLLSRHERYNKRKGGLGK